MKIITWMFIANFLLLMQLGAEHVEEPFITIGQWSTAFYFAWFLILVPLVGIIENTLMDIALDNEDSTLSSPPLLNAISIDILNRIKRLFIELKTMQMT